MLQISFLYHFRNNFLNFLLKSVFTMAIYSIFDTLVIKPEVEITFPKSVDFFLLDSVRGSLECVCAKFEDKWAIFQKVIKKTQWTQVRGPEIGRRQSSI